MKLSKSSRVISDLALKKKKKNSDLEDFKNFNILILQTSFFTKNICFDSNSSELDVICTTSIKRTFGKERLNNTMTRIKPMQIE